MSEQSPENTGNTAQDPSMDDPESPLRGSLADNADESGVHNMGGETGPADDSSRREALRDTDLAVPVDDVVDRADDDGGGNGPIGADRDPQAQSIGRGADGDTDTRLEQKERGEF